MSRKAPFSNGSVESEIEGRDAQLERGIAEVMARLKGPVKLPAKPPGPVKTGR